jgi:hypothetical protein
MTRPKNTAKGDHWIHLETVGAIKELLKRGDRIKITGRWSTLVEIDYHLNKNLSDSLFDLELYQMIFRKDGHNSNSNLYIWRINEVDIAGERGMKIKSFLILDKLAR